MPSLRRFWAEMDPSIIQQSEIAEIFFSAWVTREIHAANTSLRSPIIAEPAHKGHSAAAGWWNKCGLVTTNLFIASPDTMHHATSFTLLNSH
ncbi:hypothetical protein CEXT_175751 [Caerostris extrusa]|uniref:Uncharacterized protein n=1 Tax=Caerostris extrusa TaxID=172846 RepID=A0AAV4MFU3_CAEEX|nr:hypothetical protein CEXT_175751 [Caerostris extrusa]